MSKLDSYFNGKIFFQFLILIICLLISGSLLQEKVGRLLNAALETTIARQTADLSVVADERFKRDLAELSFAAHYIEAHPSEETERNIMEELQREDSVSAGMMQPGGAILHGREISGEDFPHLPAAFRGNSVVDYHPERGLLFAVPVMRGENVRAILYRLYDIGVLADFFDITEYNSSTHLLIQQRDGQIIVPYRNYDIDAREFFDDPTVAAGYGIIRGKLLTTQAAATYIDGGIGRYFLFGADLPETNCAMIGYVPWEAVANDLFHIYTLTLRVGSVILLLFAVIGIYLFITRAKAEEGEAWMAAKEAADQANRAKSTFLANMSHEIRTPLNSILGLNEIVLRESTNPAVRGYAQNIANAGTTLLSLINDILDFSKIESGRMEVIPTDYNLRHLLTNIVNIMRPRAQKKGLAFSIEVDPVISCGLHGDNVRVQQILMNLLSNAIKYTLQGSVALRVQQYGFKDSQIFLRFIVKDTGIGIRSEDQARLFKDFERFDSERNRGIEGTGLGLAITYRLVHLLGGEIRVESAYGKGTSFFVELPQTVRDHAPIGDFTALASAPPSREGKNYVPRFTAPKARILVVDDTEMNLLVVTGLLKETKVQITTCTSGKECLEKLSAEDYDIVLLDHMMPGLDGVETLHLAKKMTKCKALPFIVLTANAVAGAKEMFFREGFTDYLSKPVDGRRLEEKLKRYLPPEKIQDAPTDGTASAATPPADGEYFGTGQGKEPSAKVPLPASDAPPAEEDASSLINVAMGMQYCGGIESVYWEAMELFYRLHREKQEKMEAALSAENWKEYTTLLHALKSTSLLLGGPKMSEVAKAQEMAGKRILSPKSTEEEKSAAMEELRERHGEAMQLYDAFAAEAGKKLAKREA